MTQWNFPVFNTDDPPPQCPKCKTSMQSGMTFDMYPMIVSYYCKTCDFKINRREV